MLDAIHISDDEMAGLPEGVAGFLAFEKLCRDKLESILTRYGENDNDIDVRISYLTNVISAAEHFEVPVLEDLVLDPNDRFGYGEARQIAQVIQREVTKLRFRALKERHPTSVAISEPQQAKLEHLVEQLRQRIKDSNFEEEKRKRLDRKLDELLGALRTGKPGFRDTMIILASFFTVINQAEGALIKLPDTISAVMEVFGIAKQDADARAVEDKSAKGAITDQRSASASQADLDDEIPF